MRDTADILSERQRLSLSLWAMIEGPDEVATAVLATPQSVANWCGGIRCPHPAQRKRLAQAIATFERREAGTIRDMLRRYGRERAA